MSARRNMPAEGFLLLFVIVLGWGVSWTVVKYALAEIPPLSIRGVSAVTGGVCTLLLVRAKGGSWGLARAHWFKLGVLAFFNTFIFNALATYGTYLLPSGRAALLAYTMPLWCVPFSMWLLGDALTMRRIFALILGIAGVMVLMGHSAFDLLHASTGVLLMLAAAVCWAFGVVLMKRWSLPIETSVLTGWMLLIGGLPMLPATWYFDGLPTRVPSLWALLAIAYTAFITFMLCYWAWNRLVLLVPVSVSSLSSLLTPLVGVLSGALILGERPGWPEAIAALLILGAVAVINTAPKVTLKTCNCSA